MLAVLRRHTELSKAAKLTDLCDALIAAALKMPPGKLTLALIRSHVLAHHLNVESKGGIADVATHAARRLLGEPDTGKAGPSLRQVLGRRWLYQVTSPLAPQIAQSSPRATSLQTALPGLQAPPPARPQLVTSPPANGSESGPAAISADTLLTLVREAIPQIGSDGRFGPEKVFVSAIWRRIESERRLPDLSLERFKRWLVTANRDQLLDLARADLRGAMDAKLIEESEIRDLGATFHFVVDRQAATAGRGLHAR